MAGWEFLFLLTFVDDCTILPLSVLFRTGDPFRLCFLTPDMLTTKMRILTAFPTDIALLNGLVKRRVDNRFIVSLTRKSRHLAGLISGCLSCFRARESLLRKSHALLFFLFHRSRLLAPQNRVLFRLFLVHHCVLRKELVLGGHVGVGGDRRVVR